MTPQDPDHTIEQYFSSAIAGVERVEDVERRSRDLERTAVKWARAAAWSGLLGFLLGAGMAFALLLSGCATLTPHAPGAKQLTRETWALAESREHWPDLTGDPEADLVNLALQVQELGGHIETWDDRSRVTCHDRTIHLRAGWNLSGDAYAARKLAHEVVHLAQMVEVGCAEFRRVYLDAGGRAYLELQAGGVESFGFVLYQEGTPAEHEIWVVRKVTRMYDDPAIGGGGYVLGTVDRDHWLRYAAETLRRAAR